MTGGLMTVVENKDIWITRMLIFGGCVGGETYSKMFVNMLCTCIEKPRTVPHKPQSNGLVEKSNRTLKQMLIYLQKK